MSIPIFQFIPPPEAFFMMAALKSLSDNSNISVIFVLVSIDYLLFQVEVFLFLSMSHFQCVQDILGYHARKL